MPAPRPSLNPGNTSQMKMQFVPASHFFKAISAAYLARRSPQHIIHISQLIMRISRSISCGPAAYHVDPQLIMRISRSISCGPAACHVGPSAYHADLPQGPIR